MTNACGATWPVSFLLSESRRLLIFFESHYCTIWDISLCFFFWLPGRRNEICPADKRPLSVNWHPENSSRIGRERCFLPQFFVVKMGFFSHSNMQSKKVNLHGGWTQQHYPSGVQNVKSSFLLPPYINKTAILSKHDLCLRFIYCTHSKGRI